MKFVKLDPPCDYLDIIYYEGKHIVYRDSRASKVNFNAKSSHYTIFENLFYELHSLSVDEAIKFSKEFDLTFHLELFDAQLGKWREQNPNYKQDYEKSNSIYKKLQAECMEVVRSKTCFTKEGMSFLCDTVKNRIKKVRELHNEQNV